MNIQTSSILYPEGVCHSFERLRGQGETPVPVFARRFALNPAAHHSSNNAVRSKNIWKQFAAELELEIDFLLLGLAVLTLGTLHFTLATTGAPDTFEAREVAAPHAAAPSNFTFVTREVGYLLIGSKSASRVENTTETRQVVEQCCNIQTGTIDADQLHRDDFKKEATFTGWVPNRARQILQDGLPTRSSEPAPGILLSHRNDSSTAAAKNRNEWTEARGNSFAAFEAATPARTRKLSQNKASKISSQPPNPTTTYIVKRNNQIDAPPKANVPKLARTKLATTASLVRSSLGATSVAAGNTQIIDDSVSEMLDGDVFDDTRNITLRNLTVGF